MAKKRPKSSGASDVDSSVFEIDENALDREWIAQPILFYQYAERLADARLELDEAKANFDLVGAECDYAVRSNPQVYDLDKVTERAVEKAVINQEEFQAAQRKVQKAKHKVDVLQAFVTALDHRKRALEKLVDLFGMNYYAKPEAGTAESKETMSRVRKKSVRSRR